MVNTRQAVIHTVANAIMQLPATAIVRVGIDGVDGAGKSVFGDELAQVLSQAGRNVIRASVDGFHNPRTIRYRQGRHSPQGYFEDSYNYPRLKTLLLDPLSPGGTCRYRTAAFDHRTDQAVCAPEAQAQAGDILVFDGIFLHRPELREYWDFSVFLQIGATLSMARCAKRDGTSPDPLDHANRRYIEGQQRYMDSCAPKQHATIVIDNEVLADPVIVLYNRPAT